MMLKGRSNSFFKMLSPASDRRRDIRSRPRRSASYRTVQHDRNTPVLMGAGGKRGIWRQFGVSTFMFKGMSHGLDNLARDGVGVNIRMSVIWMGIQKLLSIKVQ